MATLKQVIADRTAADSKDPWNIGHLMESEALKTFDDSQILAECDRKTKDWLSAIPGDKLDGTHVHSITHVYMPFEEFPSPTNTSGLGPSIMKFSEQRIVPFVRVQVFGDYTLETMVNPCEENTDKLFNRLNDVLAQRVAWQFNQNMGRIINSLSLENEVIVGDGTENFSSLMVFEARAKNQKLTKPICALFMNSTTLYDIQKKQRDGTIKESLINEPLVYQYDPAAKGMIAKITDTARYVYMGSVPVYINNAMKDGLISICEPGAFLFHNRDDLPIEPLHNKDDLPVEPYEDVLGVKISLMYVLTPYGFNMIKEPRVDGRYGGPTFAELDADAETGAGKALYEPLPDKSLTRILNLKVKIG